MQQNHAAFPLGMTPNCCSWVLGVAAALLCACRCCQVTFLQASPCSRVDPQLDAGFEAPPASCFALTVVLPSLSCW